VAVAVLGVLGADIGEIFGVVQEAVDEAIEP
jgi:hypothetical protein